MLRLLLILVVLTSATAMANPRTVKAEPLATRLANVKVGEVKGQTLTVPIITWGGDIATIVANGNAAQTAPGSIAAAADLKLKLVREDVFARQVEAYIKGESPFLRGTVGMLSLASDVLNKDPRTRPLVIHQMTWSAGGDALVVKSGIGAAADLRGKTIALQADGPHIDYLTRVLADAGLKPADVKLRWLPDLTGTDDSPAAAFRLADVDAAFVIIPDALQLTAGGTVGTGAEDSVKGARILLSTKTANRIIADVYAVRTDYYEANREQVAAFVNVLLRGTERLQALQRERSSKPAPYRAAMTAAAKLLLDSEDAITDAEGLVADAEFVGYAGTRTFLTDSSAPRALAAIAPEVQKSFVALGLSSGRHPLRPATLDFTALVVGLANTRAVEAPRFDEQQVAQVVTRRQQQGALDEGQLFSFEIFFEPNQNEFTADLYEDAFNRVVDLAATYGGALITIEGHSDPMGYLRDKKEGKPELVLSRVKQSARNLSLSRAVAVRDSVMSFAQTKGITLDSSQFAVLGLGITRPRGGICGDDPCAPKNEREWRDNMRVEFRIIQVEAESSVFRPL